MLAQDLLSRVDTGFVLILNGHYSTDGDSKMRGFSLIKLEVQRSVKLPEVVK